MLPHCLVQTPPISPSIVTSRILVDIELYTSSFIFTMGVAGPSEHSIRSQLLVAGDDFLDAVAQGPHALDAFYDRWTSLHDVLSQPDTSLSQGTLEIAHGVSKTIALLAETFMQLDLSAQETSARLAAETEEILDKAFPQPSRPARPATAEKTNDCVSPFHADSLLPPYIPPAYKWLLKNVHNPYPSKPTKLSFAEETGSSPSNIDAWFVHIRRRIGWTTLVRKWYKGSRSDAIDAAYRALVDDDPIRPLDATLRMEFIQVEANARELYAHKLVKSSLAGQMNRAVHDMTDIDRRRREELRALEAEEKRKRIHKQKEMARIQRAEEKVMQRMKRARAKSSYPSPDRSLSAPLASDATDESDGELEEQRPIRSSRKQKRRSSPDSGDDLDASPCNKRPR